MPETQTSFQTFPMPADLGSLMSDELICPPDEGDEGEVIVDPANEARSPAHEFIRTGETSAKPTHPPFPGELEQGDDGRAVIALERALIRAKIRTTRADSHFDYRTRWGVRQFQRQQGLQITGKVNHETWRHFNYPKAGPGYPAGQGLFDAYGYWLVTHPKEPPAPAPSDIRSQIIRVAMFDYLHAGIIHYLEQRPMIEFKSCPPAVDSYADCSEEATHWYFCGGGPDPTGFNFSGYGNTDSMIANGESVPLPRPADLILYTNPGHVTLCTSWPMCVSHGSEGGPYYMDARYRPIAAFRSYL